MKSIQSILKGYKNICWYPSAGFDLLAPLYLSDVESKIYAKHDYFLPDCYLFTDYYGDYFVDQIIESFSNKSFIKINNKAMGYSSEVRVLSFEELAPLNISFKRNLVAFDNNDRYNKAYHFNVEIRCEEILKKGVINTSIIYVIAENTSFLFEYLVKNNIHTSHFIHKCYGEAFGGGKSTGQILYLTIDKLKVKYLIKDQHYVKDLKDIAFKIMNKEAYYPSLQDVNFDFTKEYGWRGYSDVKLFKVKKTK